MAITRLNSLAIPAGTVEPADISYPLTNFSSTGIDDNASTTALTIDSSGNISVTGYIAGPSTFTIDPAAVGDNTGTLVIAGNLQVDGTTTTINSTTMTVDDLNITLASGAANAAAANGAGITVDGASASLTYDGTNDKWDFNKNVKITGTVETSSGLILAGHPVVGYSSITGGYATRLGSTGTSTLNVTQIYARGSHVATFDGATGRVGIGETSPDTVLHLGAASPHIDLGASGSNRGKVGYDNTHVYIGSTSSTGSIYFKNNISSTDAPWSSGDTKMIVGDGGITTFQTLTTSIAGNTKHLVLNNTGATQWEFYSYNDGNLYINALPSGGSTSTKFTLTDDGHVIVKGASYNDNRFYLTAGNSGGEGVEVGRVSIGRGGTSYPHLGYNAGPTGSNGYVNKYIADKSSWIDFHDGHIRFWNDTGTTAAGAITGTERVRILSSGGITFNGDTATANALDDYEEGTWSPSLSTGSATFTSPKYTKIGRLVFLEVLITAFSDRTTSSAIVVNGLPYTTSSNSRAAGNTLSRYINSGGDQVVTWVGTSRNYMTFYTVNQGSDYQNVQHNQLNSASSNFHVSVVYET